MNPQSHIYSTVAPWPDQDDGEAGRQQRGLAIAAITKIERNRLGYNQAQRDEKRVFMRLLSDLCNTIPEPPQTFGRPRLSLSEMVSAVGLKVYSTVSERRFMGDLDTAHEKGYISRLPHDNNVFNYLENPTLTSLWAKRWVWLVQCRN